MYWLSRRCGGSVGDVVVQWGMYIYCIVAHLGMWWLVQRCGGSFRDVVAPLWMERLNCGCGTSIGGCFGSAGNVVA
jgi:hypothetical protein